jgi:hypothetical protein
MEDTHLGMAVLPTDADTREYPTRQVRVRAANSARGRRYGQQIPPAGTDTGCKFRPRAANGQEASPVGMPVTHMVYNTQQIWPKPTKETLVDRALLYPILCLFGRRPPLPLVSLSSRRHQGDAPRRRSAGPCPLTPPAQGSPNRKPVGFLNRKNRTGIPVKPTGIPI